MTPTAHTSTLLSYGNLLQSSGAMYMGLPRFSFSFYSGSYFTAKPKSVSLMYISSGGKSEQSSTRTFSGLRSLCIMFLLCMKLSARSIWLIT